MRFWSAVFTVETDHGRHWFKVANPGQGFEAQLSLTLAGLVPDHVVAPVAVDVDRAWILTADQGPTLRDSGPATIEQWELVGRETARMQQALVPHAAKVIGAGVSALAASDVPAYVMAAVYELEHLPDDHPQHVTAEVADRVLATIPQRQDDATLLDASGLPDTLQHNDLGDANAFVDGERVRLLDLGDSFWSHPLPVMEIPLVKAVGWPLPGLDDERVRRVLLAYLAEWSDEPEPLLDLWPAARRLARVHRFASWTRVCAEVPPEFAVEDDLRLIDYLDPKLP